MELTSRRQLTAIVTTLKINGLMAEVTVEVAGGEELVPVITRTAAERLTLRVGDRVTVIITPTEILLSK
jgi:molybdopterin-binding protein